MAPPPPNVSPGRGPSRDERGGPGPTVAPLASTPAFTNATPAMCMMGNQPSMMAMAAAYHQQQQQFAYWYYMYANALQAYHMQEKNKGMERVNKNVTLQNTSNAISKRPSTNAGVGNPNWQGCYIQKAKASPNVLTSDALLPPQMKKEISKTGTFQLNHITCKLKRDREASPCTEENAMKKQKPGLETKVCNNCGTSDTPFWRKEKVGGMPLCNACGLYSAKNDAPRPKLLWRRPSTPPKTSA